MKLLSSYFAVNMKLLCGYCAVLNVVRAGRGLKLFGCRKQQMCLYRVQQLTCHNLQTPLRFEAILELNCSK